MIAWLKKIITPLYHFLCFHILQMDEFFTPWLTRIMIANGVFSHLFVAFLYGICFYGLFIVGTFWSGFWGAGGIYAIALLLDHLVDTARIKPQNLHK